MKLVSNCIYCTHADTEDLNMTVSYVTFVADERTSVPSLYTSVLIHIVDDDKDEAYRQFFIATLEIVDAVNMDLINIGRAFTRGIIVDNDGKYNYLMHSSFSCHHNVVIRIGYAQEVYQYFEPDFPFYINNVTLVKEDNRVSEQTFGVGITVSNPQMLSPATLEPDATTINFDYTLGVPGQKFTVLNFLPNQQSITFNFFLNNDDLPEETEAFQASSTSVEGFPPFQAPLTTSFPSTEIQIIDNDCKCITV